MTFLTRTHAAAPACRAPAFPLRAALQIRRERRALAGLSDGALNDIGLTRAEARSEARRPLWDVPARRRC